MTSAPLSPRHILAVMDESESQLALRSALSLAEAHGAALDVFACVELPSDLGIIGRLAGSEPDTLTAKLVDQKRAATRARLKAVFPDRNIEPHIATGKTFLEVIRHVSDIGCDFVVKAAEPLTGVNRFLFASTDQHLLRKCPCPVWLQTPTAPATPKRILAAIDLDLWDAEEPETLNDLNRRVVQAARGIANTPDAEVIVLHAWDAIGEGIVWAFTTGKDARASADRYVNQVHDRRQKAMSDFIASFADADASGPRLVPALLRGTPERVIEKQSRVLHADVVVMGTVARTGVSGIFIGNTAENIINSLGCPVLAVKPDGFISPVLIG